MPVIKRMGMQVWMAFEEFENNKEPVIDAFAGDQGQTWTCKIEGASKGKRYYLESVTAASNWRAKNYVFKLAQ